MAKSAESPHTTRRRVWTFVICCIVLVLVVGLWPLKAYWISDEKFIEALGSPRFGTSNMDVLDLIREGRLDFPLGHARLTDRQGTESAEMLVGEKRRNPFYTEVPGFDPVAWRDQSTGTFQVLVHWRNTVHWMRVGETPRFQGKRQEEIAHACHAAILDGIEREIPGVMTYYNPPARQLYYERVRPFLSKLFPKAFGPVIIHAD